MEGHAPSCPLRSGSSAFGRIPRFNHFERNNLQLQRSPEAVIPAQAGIHGADPKKLLPPATHAHTRWRDTLRRVLFCTAPQTTYRDAPACPGRSRWRDRQRRHRSYTPHRTCSRRPRRAHQGSRQRTPYPIHSGGASRHAGFRGQATRCAPNPGAELTLTCTRTPSGTPESGR